MKATTALTYKHFKDNEEIHPIAAGVDFVFKASIPTEKKRRIPAPFFELFHKKRTEKKPQVEEGNGVRKSVCRCLFKKHTNSIIILNVIMDKSSGLSQRLRFIKTQGLRFEHAEEIFYDGIIIGISGP